MDICNKAKKVKSDIFMSEAIEERGRFDSNKKSFHLLGKPISFAPPIY